MVQLKGGTTPPPKLYNKTLKERARKKEKIGILYKITIKLNNYITTNNNNRLHICIIA